MFRNDNGAYTKKLHQIGFQQAKKELKGSTKPLRTRMKTAAKRRQRKKRLSEQ